MASNGDSILFFLTEANDQFSSSDDRKLIAALKSVRKRQLKSGKSITLPALGRLFARSMVAPRRLDLCDARAINDATGSAVESVYTWIVMNAGEAAVELTPLAGFVMATALGLLRATSEDSIKYEESFKPLCDKLRPFLKTPREDVEALCPQSEILTIAAMCDPRFEPMVGSQTLLEYYFANSSARDAEAFLVYARNIAMTARKPLMSEAIRAAARLKVPRDAGEFYDVLELSEHMLFFGSNPLKMKMFYNGEYVTKDVFAEFETKTEKLRASGRSWASFGRRYAFLDRDVNFLSDDEDEE